MFRLCVLVAALLCLALPRSLLAQSNAGGAPPIIGAWHFSRTGFGYCDLTITIGSVTNGAVGGNFHAEGGPCRGGSPAFSARISSRESTPTSMGHGSRSGG